MRPGRVPALHRAFPIVAAALGRRFGVDVVVQGSDAMTNGKTIVLPALPPDSSLMDVAWGYLAHEAAHVRYTDFEAIGHSGSSPLRKEVTNILEDVRIEKALALEYPGTRQTIGKVLEYLVGTNQLGALPHGAHPAAILQAYLLLRLRADVLGQAVLAREADKAEAVLRKTFPKGAVTRLNGLLTNVASLSSSADAAHLADDILRMLQEEKEKEARQAASSRKGRSTGQATSSGTGASDAQAADGRDQDGPSSGQGVAAANVTNRQSGGSRNAAKTLKEALSASDSDIAKDMFEAVSQILGTAATPGEILMPAATRAVDSRKARDLLIGGLAESARLRAKLTGLVQAHRLDRHWVSTRGRKIDRSRLHRLNVGDARVFVRPHHRIAPNTAIHLLVDTSSSMRADVTLPDGTRTTRCEIALRSSLVLALALEAIPGVNPGVSSFPGYTGVAVILPHGERARPNAGRFDQPAAGGTPMAPAIWYAASVLLAQREPHKVLMVLTDGMPDNEQSTRDIVGRCMAGGIETIGVGIELPRIGQLFPRSVVINRVEDLRTVLFDVAHDTLTAA